MVVYMVSLFETTTINGMTLRNRFVRSATYEGLAHDDLTVSQRLIDLMVALADGGVGLIITGLATVTRDGQNMPWQLGIYADDQVPGLMRMTRAVHDAGGTIMIQLAHGGAQGNPELTGELLGPSAIPAIGGEGAACRAMTLAEIHRIVEAFGEAGRRAQEAGFDGVQLHGAHGFLLSEYLSPFFNKRTDQYGGSLANRARIVVEAYHRVRAAVGATYPVTIKLNSEDFLEGGLTVAEMVQVASWLETAGIDAIEVSGGTSWALGQGRPNASYARLEHTDLYYRDAARRYKAAIRVPLMLVGGIRSYDVARQLVAEGVTDYISLSRPLIREPDLVNRWKAGDTRPSGCVSDNACFGPLRAGNGLQCVHVKK
jgi:2,4-dienoyl-CoA reductase-like NADH-dependent reductase (Old Yellow Enzyme family)